MNLAPATRSASPLSVAEEVEAAPQVAEAFAGARAAQRAWARVPVAERLKRVRRVRHLLAAEGTRLAAASAGARHRPVGEALTAEVLPLAEACRFLEREAAVWLAPQPLGRAGRPWWLAGVHSEIYREPFGVVLIIGPGNYPLLLPGVQVLQALVAGNAVVLKPGRGGTAAASALLELCARAGLPPELTALLPESTAAARAAILARPDKVVFTGSAPVGAAILEQLAPLGIPATLELSGCDAVVVRADADLDLAARALAFGLRLNGGATCLAPKRVFVARSVAGELEKRVAGVLKHHAAQEVAASLNPCAEECPPLLAPSLVTAAARKVEEALALGAHVVAGNVLEDGSLQLPLVLGGVSARARLLQEDFFLPLLAMVAVADDHEAVLRANACPFALGASVFSRDETVAQGLATRLNAGVVTINDLIVPTADPRLPFGGRQRSGFGVTRGAEGLLELTRHKVVTRSRGRFRPAYEPARPGDEHLFQAYLHLAHGSGWRQRWRGLVSLGRTLARKRKAL